MTSNLVFLMKNSAGILEILTLYFQGLSRSI